MVMAYWNIREGEPTYVRKIMIVGNDYTHDRIIRSRISLLPGDVFSQARLINSVQAVHSHWTSSSRCLRKNRFGS